MLRTRLIVGTILATLAAGMLILDEHLAPWFPFLFLTVAFIASAGTVELVRLLPEMRRPNVVLCLGGVLSLTTINWCLVVASRYFHADPLVPANAFSYVLVGFAVVILLAFIFEMAAFRTPGGSVERMALTVWTVAYLGILPSFLIQLRAGPPEVNGDDLRRTTVALAMAIFIPKCCDIGAYFTGRLIGRHPMTPTLSPKKTWEGFFGGLAVAVAVTFGLNSLGPVIRRPAGDIVGIGLFVGVAGILGDLAESLVKRDCERKDASAAIPGFGGILDVVDSILFAAPVTYWGLH
jgi:phosphatidate cytidylyltransferase